MSQTLFISDLHLQKENPEITEIFLQFLKNDAVNAEALYILGDLFEVWIGDDDDNDFITLIKAGLKNITSKKVPIYIMPGNRDFLLGKKFAEDTGCHLLKDPTYIRLYGIPTVLTHGDLLCLADKRHQVFRHLTQNQWVKNIFLLLPLRIRHKIAQKIRHVSKNHTRTLGMNIMDVTPKARNNLLESMHATRMIHGHTHRPVIETLPTGQMHIVLGAWENKVHALVCEPNEKPRFETTSTAHQNKV